MSHPHFLKKIIVFPIKNTIFRVQKSSKDKQKQAFFKTENTQKNNFSCDDVFAAAAAAAAVAVVAVVAVYLYMYIASPSTCPSKQLAPCSQGDTHESCQLVVKHCGIAHPAVGVRRTQAWSTCGEKLRLAATSVVLLGNGEVK